MKLLLLIIPIIISCDTEAVADVDALYNAYLCNVGTNASTVPQQPDDTTPPDSINVFWENVGYTGDSSYTEDDAVTECEVAFSDSTAGGPVIVIVGVEVSRPYYCQCEKAN